MPAAGRGPPSRPESGDASQEFHAVRFRPATLLTAALVIACALPAFAQDAPAAPKPRSMQEILELSLIHI